MPALVGPKALNYYVASVRPRRGICATGPDPGVWCVFDGGGPLGPRMETLCSPRDPVSPGNQRRRRQCITHARPRWQPTNHRNAQDLKKDPLESNSHTQSGRPLRTSSHTPGEA